MKIESDIFVNNSSIPIEYTCDGKGIQPPLKISGVPAEAKSLALIVDDPDAPSGDFVHWIVWNIDPNISVIENSNVSTGAVEGYTSLNKSGFVAPCPPSGIHHYNFKLYALDTILSIPKSSNKADLVRAMDKHIINNATLVGLYERNKTQ
ncbi:MAG: YbhB/YbcL family Raf kinase inhibitor-like protein [Candidatus Paceibacterota bacterium]